MSLLLGTSSWTAEGWEKAFYPPELPQRDWLGYYALKFPAVEVDATFYRIPAPSMVKRWREITPEGFQIAAKVPKSITHDKLLVDCEDEMAKFLEVMALLGDRLGPLLIQMQYLNKKAMPTLDDFLRRLDPFLAKLPSGFRWALEIRNKTWLQPRLLELLRGCRVTLALIDHPWMPRPASYPTPPGEFAYVRWLGDRYKIEEQTQVWDKVIVDREQDLGEWIPVVQKFLDEGKVVYAFANNHYAGHAPATIELFRRLISSRK